MHALRFGREPITPASPLRSTCSRRGSSTRVGSTPTSWIIRSYCEQSEYLGFLVASNPALRNCLLCFFFALNSVTWLNPSVFQSFAYRTIFFLPSNTVQRQPKLESAYRGLPRHHATMEVEETQDMERSWQGRPVLVVAIATGLASVRSFQYKDVDLLSGKRSSPLGWIRSGLKFLVEPFTMARHLRTALGYFVAIATDTERVHHRVSKAFSNRP